jgi:Zn-dependent peptidase ImmA (M78 family)
VWRSAPAAARHVRAQLGVAPDAPLRCLLRAVEDGLGVAVVLLDLGPGTAGALLRRGGRAFAFVHGGQPVVRQRFTLAHEAGHHVLGHGPGLDSPQTIFTRTFDPLEAQANAFAAELIAPIAAVRRLAEELGPRPVTLELVVRVAAASGLSAQAARIRLQAAGVLRDGALAARLDREIGQGLHTTLAASLGLREHDDELARAARHLPRLPDAARGSALAALLDGSASTDDVARAVGHGSTAVERAVRGLGVALSR